MAADRHTSPPLPPLRSAVPTAGPAEALADGAGAPIDRKSEQANVVSSIAAEAKQQELSEISFFQN